MGELELMLMLSEPEAGDEARRMAMGEDIVLSWAGLSAVAGTDKRRVLL